MNILEHKRRSLLQKAFEVRGCGLIAIGTVITGPMQLMTSAHVTLTPSDSGC